MHKYLEAILGFSPVALVRAARFGPRDAYLSCRANYRKTDPWMDRQLKSIPIVPVEDLLGKEGSLIPLRVMKYEDGMLPMRDAIGLLSLLLSEKPREVLEIGTYMGHTARAMAEALPQSIIHTVDLPVDYKIESDAKGSPPKDDFHLISQRVVGREFKGQPCELRILQHFGDTANMDFSQLGHPTFFFIDGSHTYEYCKNDSEKCLDLCAGKGTLLWHDCDSLHPGVIRSISELRGTGKNIVRLENTSLAYWKGD